MATTLREVAKTLNLSPGLVSRVLNNDATVRASAETRERIVTTARAMKYRPSPSARALSTGRSRQIALSGADFGLHFYSATRLLEQQGVIEAAAKEEYQVVVLPSTQNEAEGTAFEEIFYTSGCDGVCLYAEQASEAVYTVLRQLNVPFVVIGNPGDDSLPRVDHDNRRYAFDSVSWLAAQGRCRIAFADFLSPESRPFAAALWQGYTDALATHFGSDAAPLFLPYSSAPHARTDFLRQSSPPEAVMTTGWQNAMRWQEAAQKVGLRLPDDLAILVHLPAAESLYVGPGLAYHTHDPRAVGLEAGAMLLRRIRENTVATVETVLIAPDAPQWQRSDWLY